MIRIKHVICIFFLFNLSCVNIFDPIDNPSTPVQKLAAARACFDQGDLECAHEYYTEVLSENGDSVQIALAERALIALDKAGAGMADFIRAFGDGSGGAGITKLANRLARTASQAQRDSIYQAYRVTGQISDPAIRGYLRFITAITLAAEILAESTGGDFSLQASDLAGSVADVTTCKATTSATCGVTAACDSDGNLSNSAPATNWTDLSATQSATDSNYQSLQSLAQIISVINTALNEMNATGKFKSGTGAFSQSILDLLSGVGLGGGNNAAAGARCMIRELLVQGVGN